MSNKSKEPEVEIGTGSASEQPGLPNSEERLRKARFMNVINDVIKRRELSQKMLPSRRVQIRPIFSEFGMAARPAIQPTGC
jgi:hypothetical protein